jgi:thiamine-phosphate pyrophosphorylase
MRPVVCMVTAPVRSADAIDRLIDRIGWAARGGAHLIQIRQPGVDALTLTRIAERALLAARGTSARVLINDRVDVALAVGAHGVHLRGDSMPAARVRAIAPPGFLVGRSIRSAADARQTMDACLDYLIFGTVFATGSKPGVAPSGVAALADVARAVPIPVLAIGGITSAALSEVARAGASGFAAIGMFDDPEPETLPGVIRLASSAFDTPGSVP